MASITRRPAAPARRRTDTAEHVLDAARRLLQADVSYTELSVQRIIEEAGVARSSFYAHFPDKTKLLLALAGRMSFAAFASLEEWTPERDDALPRLIEAFTAIVAHYREHAQVLAALLEVAGYDQGVRGYWAEQLALFRGRFQHALEAEQAAGRCSPTLDPESAARIVVDGGMRTIADQVANGSAGDDRRIAREMSLIWWHGTFRRP
jgi:AcrR family transcriptional regulator